MISGLLSLLKIKILFVLVINIFNESNSRLFKKNAIILYNSTKYI